MTAPTIKPIETRYRGYRFRSRLEARWAVAFDHLGMPWQYEVQGFALPNGPYLPDFQLAPPNFRDTSGNPTPLYAEVKGDLAAFADRQKLYEFAQQGHNIVLLGPIPDVKNAGFTLSNPIFEWHGPCDTDGLDAWHGVHSGWLVFAGPGVVTGSTGSRAPYFPVMEQALDAGRQARFEHGEQP